MVHERSHPLRARCELPFLMTAPLPTTRHHTASLGAFAGAVREKDGLFEVASQFAVGEPAAKVCVAHPGQTAGTRHWSQCVL